MQGPADSPLVSLTGEDFRSAETWEYADDGPGDSLPNLYYMFVEL